MSKFIDGVYSTPLSGMRAFREEGRIVIEAGCAGYFCEIDCEGNDDAEATAIDIVDAITAQIVAAHKDEEDVWEPFSRWFTLVFDRSPDPLSVADSDKFNLFKAGYLYRMGTQ